MEKAFKTKLQPITCCGKANYSFFKDKDEHGTEPPDKALLIHDCDKLKVYQKSGELGRYFIKK